jgi:hypothetical protein
VLILFFLTVLCTVAWLLVLRESTSKRLSRSFWPGLIRNPEIERWVDLILMLILAVISTFLLATVARAVLFKR